MLRFFLQICQDAFEASWVVVQAEGTASTWHCLATVQAWDATSPALCSLSRLLPWHVSCCLTPAAKLHHMKHITSNCKLLQLRCTTLGSRCNQHSLTSPATESWSPLSERGAPPVVQHWWRRKAYLILYSFVHSYTVESRIYMNLYSEYDLTAPTARTRQANYEFSRKSVEHSSAKQTVSGRMSQPLTNCCFLMGIPSLS